MVVLWLCLMLTWHVTSLNEDYSKWLYHTYKPIKYTTCSFFLLITFISTGVTIVAIIKIFEITKELVKCYNKVSINKYTMILHSVLLLLFCAASILFSVTERDPGLRADLNFDILTVFDLIV